jgi:hypothetical protein
MVRLRPNMRTEYAMMLLDAWRMFIPKNTVVRLASASIDEVSTNTVSL